MSGYDNNSSNNHNKPASSPYGKPMKMMDSEGDDGPTRRVGASPGAISFTSVSASQFIPALQNTQTVKQQQAKIVETSAQSSEASATAFCWKLQTVPTLPPFRLLERTAVFVEHTSPSTVSGRISAVLRQRSIEAYTYNDVKAKVHCITSQGVDFRIRLYRGRGEQYRHGIIVEVQRRFGDSSVDFYRDTRAILRAAQGKKDEDDDDDDSNASLPMVPEDMMVSMSENSGEEEGELGVFSRRRSSSEVGSLEMVAKLFAHDGYESCYLALQTLVSLTDATRMGPDLVKNVSNELLKQPESPILTKLIQLALSQRKQQHDEHKKDEGDEGADEQETEAFQLRLLALTILANALSVQQQQQQSQQQQRLLDKLHPALLRELEQASNHTLAAQQAARCVEYFFANNNHSKHKITTSSSSQQQQQQLQAALETARAAGAARHVGLEQQAKAALAQMV